MDTQLHQLEAVFNAAADLPADQRPAALDALCGQDKALRARAESLLAELDAGTRGVLSSRPAAAAPCISRIGDFGIIRLLGEGGMGSVFEARQSSPSRTVALKLIRGGIASREQERRFSLEAELLASLKHPGIAQVYQAGIAADEVGRHHQYIAMELVNGKPLCEHARLHQLSIPQRIELLARVCDAVQHAHQNGVIHRDLKPGNILIELDAGGGGIGQPKVLDFGIARRDPMADSSQPSRTQLTMRGLMIGTLGYSSPEQADGGIVDTRSDVYSLGVVGFELFAGKLPLDLESRPLSDAARVVREVTPPPLGTLNAQCRGDLQVIIAKALEKDPGMRYASAGELAADLRRVLNHEPIVARPASLTYQLRRFARRHRGVVASLGLAACSIVAGAIFGTVQYWRAVDALSMAKEQQAAAIREATRLSRTLQFVHDEIFSQAFTNRVGPNVSVLESLRNSDQTFNDLESIDPGSACRLRSSAAHILFGALDYAGAADQFIKAARCATLMGEAGLADLHAAKMYAGYSLMRIGRSGEAIAQLREALTIALKAHGPAVDEYRIRAFLGAALAEAGDFDAAFEQLNAAMRFTQEKLTATPGSWFWITSRLIQAHLSHGDPLAAAAIIECHETAAANDPNERAICDQLTRNAAAAFEEAGYFKEALAWRQRAVQWRMMPSVAPAYSAEVWWVMAEQVQTHRPADADGVARCTAAAGRTFAKMFPQKQVADWMMRLRIQSSWEAVTALHRGDVAQAAELAGSAAGISSGAGTIAHASLSMARTLDTKDARGSEESRLNWSTDGLRAEPGKLVYAQVMTRVGKFDEAIAAAITEHSHRAASLGILAADTARARTQVCASLAAAGQSDPLKKFVDQQWELLSQSPNRASSESLRALVMLADGVALAHGNAAMSRHLMAVLQQRIDEDRVPRWATIRCAIQMIESMHEHGEGAAAATAAQTVRSWLERSGMGQSSWAKKVDAAAIRAVSVSDRQQ